MDETDPTTVLARARVGSTLNGRWHLDQLVGVGGMAAVYAATHRNGKRVAVKILHPEISLDDNARQRFLREGYAANQVGHRGAVAADDDGTTEDGTAFLVMELLEGETIEQRFAHTGGTLPAVELLPLMDQALATLVAAHDQGIVHRDLKPENLFITRDGVLKVLDFGIARMRDRFGKSPSQTQGVMGTPSFMAPEQARGRWEDVDARTDLWAIGATMFSALSGRVVHQAETPNETLVLAITERAPALTKVVPNAHPAVAALVDKALSYERELRFQSAIEFRHALRRTYAAITDNESLPPISVPALIVSPVVHAVSPRLPTESGVAASVRGAETRMARTKPSAKTKLALLSMLGVGLLGFVSARSLSGAHGKPAPIALEGRAQAAGVLLPVRAASEAYSAPIADAPMVTAPVVEAPRAPASASARTSAPLVAPARPIAARTAVSTPALVWKAQASKPSPDLFAKRH
jgi:serine/threonine-protein kinase